MAGRILFTCQTHRQTFTSLLQHRCKGCELLSLVEDPSARIAAVECIEADRAARRSCGLWHAAILPRGPDPLKRKPECPLFPSTVVYDNPPRSTYTLITFRRNYVCCPRNSPELVDVRHRRDLRLEYEA